MKNLKRIAVILSAMCVAVAVCGCSKNLDRELGEDDGTRLPPEEQNKVIDYEAPSVVVKMDTNDNSILDAKTKEVLFSAQIGKLDIFASENGNIDVSRKINDTMRKAFDYNTKKANEYMSGYTATDGVLTLWAYESSYEVLRNDGYVVSFAENIYMNGGGSYPVIERFGYNFDAQTGELLTLETLLDGNAEDNADMFKKLGDLIYNNIAANYTSEKADAAIEHIGELNTLERVASKGYWSLDDKGMTIVYSAGDVLPRAEGEIKVEIPAEELLKLSSNVSKYFK